MKSNILNIIIVVLGLLSVSCEKEDMNHSDLQDLSIDSLDILQANIPGGLYTDLTFINEDLGFAVSNFGDIITTTDGGYTWEQIFSSSGLFLSRIQFPDNQTGYVIGGDNTGGYLLRTNNTGQTWEIIDLHTPDNERPTGLYFINSLTGFISGKKFFRRTTDGGITWSDIPESASGNINDVSFRNHSEGYAASDNGKYFKTVDGGNTWQSLQSEADDHLKRIYFVESKTLAKCRNSVFIDLETGKEAFCASDSAFNFLFLDYRRCIGIGQHYETGFLPYGDIFITNDTWITFSQKILAPQSEAMNVTAISKVKEGKVIIIGSGTVNTSVIELRY